jgi:hypothetical protein
MRDYFRKRVLVYQGSRIKQGGKTLNPGKWFHFVSFEIQRMMIGKMKNGGRQEAKEPESHRQVGDLKWWMLL